MPTVQDCATLAFDVYDRTGNETAQRAGWTRVDGQNWAPGFAAGHYRKNAEMVVAFRGTDTDDSRDILSDAAMVPLLRRGAAQDALLALARQYNLEQHAVTAAVAGRIIDVIAQTGPVSVAIESFANQVPIEQLRHGLAYFDRVQPRPQFVTGHSLGGALAQLVSQQRSVPALAFNSPSMGTIRGAVPVTSMLIAQINARGDPLILATQSVGNLPHGRVITVEIQPYACPPQLQRRPLGWMNLLVPVPALLQREWSAASAAPG
ncbi:MAG: hypothetical protein ACRENP_22435 [Longimicrobiales bacterium]